MTNVKIEKYFKQFAQDIFRHVKTTNLNFVFNE